MARPTPIFDEAARRGIMDRIAQLDPVVKAMCIDHIFSRAADLLEAVERCESPIEQMMCVALFEALVTDPANVGDIDCVVMPQQEIHCGDQTYRVDFEIAVFLPVGFLETMTVVVECDGHEFHEKTKEQAARDKARDRAIQACGIPVLRFTGSEIWHAPWKCADQVQRAVRRLADMEIRKRSQSEP